MLRRNKEARSYGDQSHELNESQKIIPRGSGGNLQKLDLVPHFEADVRVVDLLHSQSGLRQQRRKPYAGFTHARTGETRNPAGSAWDRIDPYRLVSAHEAVTPCPLRWQSVRRMEIILAQ
jgi:hypothetical protein